MPLNKRPVYFDAAMPVYVTGVDNTSETPVAINVKDSWNISTIGDTNPLIIPANTEYQVLTIWVEVTTTATVGNRQIVVEILTDVGGDVISQPARAGVIQPENTTRYYLFALGTIDLTAFRDTDYLDTPIPPLYLIGGQVLTVYDNAGVDVNDDIAVTYTVSYRSLPASEVSTWTPNSLTIDGNYAPVGWWDFSDITTLFSEETGTTPIVADGEDIHYISDKSPSGNDLSRADISGAPAYKVNIQNGLSVGRFVSGGGDLLASTGEPTLGTTAITVFVVTQPDIISGGATNIVSWGDSDTAGGIFRITEEMAVRVGGIGFKEFSTPMSLTKFNIGVVQLAANENVTNAVGYLNGLILGTSGQSAQAVSIISGQTVINAQWDSTPGSYVNAYDGDIAEILIYDQELSVTDLNQIGQYLANKWGLSWINII